MKKINQVGSIIVTQLCYKSKSTSWWKNNWN